MVDLNIDLPAGFLDEEVRCGYTITHEMKKVWAVELDLLSKLLEVCKKIILRYLHLAEQCWEQYAIKGLYHGTMISI